MDQPWCLPRSLLRASPEGRGHVVPRDRGAVVSRPDGRDGSRQPWRRQPQRPRSDPESLRRAHESSQGELLWKLLARAPRCPSTAHTASPRRQKIFAGSGKPRPGRKQASSTGSGSRTQKEAWRERAGRRVAGGTAAWGSLVSRTACLC